jgi:hypothetical protein
MIPFQLHRRHAARPEGALLSRAYNAPSTEKADAGMVGARIVQRSREMKGLVVER